MAGTGDRTVNYDGGPMRPPGVGGWILRRRAARHGDLPSERRVAPVETVARDWAAGNGISGLVFERPAVLQLPAVAGDPPVTRLTWSAPGCLPVVLHRIEGGGHGWPGGPQFLPARMIGPTSRHPDATGILLKMVAADSWPGVSDDTVAPSGLEKRSTATTEALMRAEGEPTGAGRA